MESEKQTEGGVVSAGYRFRRYSNSTGWCPQKLLIHSVSVFSVEKWVSLSFGLGPTSFWALKQRASALNLPYAKWARLESNRDPSRAKNLADRAWATFIDLRKESLLCTLQLKTAAGAVRFRYLGVPGGRWHGRTSAFQRLSGPAPSLASARQRSPFEALEGRKDLDQAAFNCCCHENLVFPPSLRQLKTIRKSVSHIHWHRGEGPAVHQ